VARVDWLKIAAQMDAWQRFCDDEMVNYSLSYSEGDGRWEMTASSCVLTYNGYVKKAGNPIQAIEWMREIFEENREAWKQAREMGPPRPRPEQIFTASQRAAAEVTDRMLRTRVKCEVHEFSGRICSRGTKGCDWIHKD
jgi:hypothetical protein